MYQCSRHDYLVNKYINALSRGITVHNGRIAAITV